MSTCFSAHEYYALKCNVCNEETLISRGIQCNQFMHKRKGKNEWCWICLICGDSFIALKSGLRHKNCKGYKGYWPPKRDDSFHTGTES